MKIPSSHMLTPLEVKLLHALQLVIKMKTKKALR